VATLHSKQNRHAPRRLLRAVASKKLSKSERSRESSHGTNIAPKVVQITAGCFGERCFERLIKPHGFNACRVQLLITHEGTRRILTVKSRLSIVLALIFVLCFGSLVFAEGQGNTNTTTTTTTTTTKKASSSKKRRRRSRRRRRRSSKKTGNMNSNSTGNANR
jgi:hypothetical protein